MSALQLAFAAALSTLLAGVLAFTAFTVRVALADRPTTARGRWIERIGRATDRDAQRWAFLAHRATGVAVFAFLLPPHSRRLALRVSPARFDEVHELYGTTPLRLFESALLFAILFHALNGLRLVLSTSSTSDLGGAPAAPCRGRPHRVAGVAASAVIMQPVLRDRTRAVRRLPRDARHGTRARGARARPLRGHTSRHGCRRRPARASWRRRWSSALWVAWDPTMLAAALVHAGAGIWLLIAEQAPAAASSTPAGARRRDGRGAVSQSARPRSRRGERDEHERMREENRTMHKALVHNQGDHVAVAVAADLGRARRLPSSSWTTTTATVVREARALRAQDRRQAVHARRLRARVRHSDRRRDHRVSSLGLRPHAQPQDARGGRHGVVRLPATGRLTSASATT